MDDSELNNQTVSLNGVVFTHADIFKVVDIFYHRIQQDPILKVPFQSVQDWPEHIKRLAHFWWARFGGRPYLDVQYNPVMKHFEAGFNEEFLQRWLSLFHETIKENLQDDQYRIWAMISEKMGASLSFRNDLLKKEKSDFS